MTNLLPSPRTLTANVTRVFRLAAPEQHAAGFDWYADAYATAHEFAATYNVTPEVAAGVIAATSPLNSWVANVSIARRMLASKGTLTTGYLGSGLAKARAIMAGSPIIETLHSEKISAFYACIVSNGLTDEVCIDRHAYDIAVNERNTDVTRPTIKGKRYAAVADAYVRAARILSREAGADISPAQVQAITWVAWRRRFWAEGAFDLKA